MNRPRAESTIALEHALGLVRVHGLRCEIAFEQSHAASVPEIDGGNQFHGDRSRSLQPQEVAQQRGANARRALRMKLRAINVAALNDGRERIAVDSRGERQLTHRRRVAVHEVDIVAASMPSSSGGPRSNSS